MNIHKNARLTPKSRAELVRRLAVGQSKAEVAADFGICTKTAAKWLARFKSLGLEGLIDLSSRPRRLRRPTPDFVAAEAGLLDDRDATTHWAFVNLLRSEHPRIRVLADRVLVSATGDGRIVTSGGAASWMDLVLYLVGKFAGPEDAKRLAKVQMFDWHHHGQNPYSRLTTRPQISDKQIQVCQEWLADHYSDADPVVEMIRQSGLSRRTFGRRFHSATGHAPLDYVQRTRIEEAKQLLETDDRTIEQIAAEVGYSDTVSFRRLFKRMVGETPTAYRRRQSVSEAARTISQLPSHPEQAGVSSTIPT